MLRQHKELINQNMFPLLWPSIKSPYVTQVPTKEVIDILMPFNKLNNGFDFIPKNNPYRLCLPFNCDSKTLIVSDLKKESDLFKCFESQYNIIIYIGPPLGSPHSFLKKRKHFETALQCLNWKSIQKHCWKSISVYDFTLKNKCISIPSFDLGEIFVKNVNLPIVNPTPMWDLRFTHKYAILKLMGDLQNWGLNALIPLKFNLIESCLKEDDNHDLKYVLFTFGERFIRIWKCILYINLTPYEKLPHDVAIAKLKECEQQYQHPQECGQLIDIYMVLFFKYKHYLPKVCFGCFKHFKKLKQCKNCKKVVYCSKNCQRLHWNQIHKSCCEKICNIN